MILVYGALVVWISGIAFYLWFKYQWKRGKVKFKLDDDE